MRVYDVTHYNCYTFAKVFVTGFTKRVCLIHASDFAIFKKRNFICLSYNYSDRKVIVTNFKAVHHTCIELGILKFE